MIALWWRQGQLEKYERRLLKYASLRVLSLKKMGVGSLSALFFRHLLLNGSKASNSVWYSSLDSRLWPPAPSCVQGDVKAPSRLTKQVVWMCSLHNTCWTEQKKKKKQHLTLRSAWVHRFLRHGGALMQVFHPRSVCFNTARICVCLFCAGSDAWATRSPLSFCVFSNMSKSLSELGATTVEETGSHERWQQDAAPSLISS